MPIEMLQINAIESALDVVAVASFTDWTGLVALAAAGEVSNVVHGRVGNVWYTPFVCHYHSHVP